MARDPDQPKRIDDLRTCPRKCRTLEPDSDMMQGSIPEAAMSDPSDSLTDCDITIPGTGHDIKALYVRCADDRTLPGIILVHDVYGITPHLRELAYAYAAAGYAVMAPNMYSRGDGPAPGWPPRTAEIAKMGNYPDLRTIDDLKCAATAIKSRPDVAPDRVAIAGYSFGARYGLFACARGAEVAALVAFYPVIMYPVLSENRPLQPLQYVSSINVPLLVGYGEQDSLVPITQVDFLRGLLYGHGKSHEFYTYPNAGHGFVNNMIKTHDETAAKDAWHKTLAFLSSQLGTP